MNQRVRPTNHLYKLTINALCTRHNQKRGRNFENRYAVTRCKVIAIFEFHERKLPRSSSESQMRRLNPSKPSKQSGNREFDAMFPCGGEGGGARRTFVELEGVEARYLPSELACQELVIDLKKCPNKMPRPLLPNVLKYPTPVCARVNDRATGTGIEIIPSSPPSRVSIRSVYPPPFPEI